MPALAILRIPKWEPEIVSKSVPTIVEGERYTIGAHADFRHEDFVFPRMQSREMQQTPWRERAKPMKSWSDIAGIGAMVGLASFAVVIGSSLI